MNQRFDSAAFGPYVGQVEATLDSPELRGGLAALTDLIARGQVVADGRNRVVRATLGTGECNVEVAIKTFARPGALERIAQAGRPSKARRSWEAARVLYEAGRWTPRPVAFLERREGRRLAEAHYVSVFEDDTKDFRKALIRVYRREPLCSALMDLLQAVADAVRGMHDAGVMHCDLGNQNIHLRQLEDGGWGEVQFTDLNRARVRADLSPRARARDLSRLHLPSDLLRVFKEMYFKGRPPPAFDRWEHYYRGCYAWHSRTRGWRHPVRSRRPRPARALDVVYPDPRDIWIWDDRSAQAINVLDRHDRHRLFPPGNTLRMVGSSLRAAVPVFRQYRALIADSFRGPVLLTGRIGMAIDPRPGDVDATLERLARLGPIPALVRFYHHEGAEGVALKADLVSRLAEGGHRVAAALVQDRAAVRDPAAWDAFLSDVLARVHVHVDEVEIGHAVNRVKWGIWGLAEHRRLLETVPELQARYPGLHFMGPAGIDFEYAHILPLLGGLAGKIRLQALSHHLYVDRRGAPENRQGPFSLLEKLALARAIASWSPACEDHLVVSEVNWPIRDTGVHSPVGSPYLYPGQLVGAPSVPEDAYADYMVRYLLIALCSGLADRVYWWSLVARGFGLVDDTDPAAWRERPAFGMLGQLLGRVGRATFTGRLPSPDGAVLFRFEGPDNEPLVIAYAPCGDVVLDPCPVCEAVEDAFGKVVAESPDRLTLTGRPLYLRQCG